MKRLTPTLSNFVVVGLLALPIVAGAAGPPVAVPVVETGSTAFLSSVWLAFVGEDGSKLGKWLVAGVEAQLLVSQVVESLLQSAERGETDAQKALADCYARGFGVPADEKVAFGWYRKAAEGGDPPAQLVVGICYFQGKGVDKDEKAGIGWFRRAADNGIADAYCLMGLCYAEGRGTPVNFSEARKWLKKAADQGDAAAQYQLGMFCAEGCGIPVSFSEARQWLRKAAAQGHAEAGEAVRVLERYSE